MLMALHEHGFVKVKRRIMHIQSDEHATQKFSGAKRTVFSRTTLRDFLGKNVR